MERITRAISIRQPWVEQILRGIKTKEFRTIPTNIRERVWLYASLTPTESTAGWRRVDATPGELPTGRILGSVEIVDCRWDNRHQRYAYVLERPMRLRRPRVATNQPSPVFWIPRFRAR